MCKRLVLYLTTELALAWCERCISLSVHSMYCAGALNGLGGQVCMNARTCTNTHMYSHTKCVLTLLLLVTCACAAAGGASPLL